MVTVRRQQIANLRHRAIWDSYPSSEYTGVYSVKADEFQSSKVRSSGKEAHHATAEKINTERKIVAVLCQSFITWETICRVYHLPLVRCAASATVEKFSLLMRCWLDAIEKNTKLAESTPHFISFLEKLMRWSKEEAKLWNSANSAIDRLLKFEMNHHSKIASSWFFVSNSFWMNENQFLILNLDKIYTIENFEIEIYLKNVVRFLFLIRFGRNKVHTRISSHIKYNLLSSNSFPIHSFSSSSFIFI